MRRDKTPTVIFTKKAESELFYHCNYHRGSRMRRFSDGLRCEFCGSPEVATRIIDTVETKKNRKRLLPYINGLYL
jgi:hypothetical protein